MAGKSDVMAGRAFVSLFLKDDMTKAMTTALRSASASLKSFGEKATQAGRSMLFVGTAAATPIALAVKRYADFDDTMRSVAGVSQATSDELASLTDKAKALGAATSFTAVQVGSLMVELGRAGFTATQINDMTGAVLNLSRATGTDATLSAGIMAASIRQFGLAAGDATRVADVLTAGANKTFNSVESLGEALSYAGPVALDFNMSLEDTVAILGQLGNVGIQGSNAGTALRRMLTITGAEAEKLKGIFGVSFVDSAGNARSLIDTLGEVEDATKNLGTAERAQKFNEAFGLLGITAASALGKTSVNARNLRDELLSVSGTAQRTADMMDSGFGGTLRILMSAVEGLAIQIGETLEPALTIIGKAFTDVTGSAIKWVKANQVIVMAAAGAIASVIGIGASLIGLGFAAKIAAFGLGGLATVIGVLTSPIGLVTAALVTGAVWWARYTEDGQRAVETLKGVFSPLAETITKTIKGVISAIQQGKWSEAGALAGMGLKLAFQDAVEGLFGDSQIKNSIYKLAELFGGGRWAEIGTLAWQGLSESLTIGMETIKANWDLWLQSLSDELYEQMGKVWEWWNQKIQAMSTTLLEKAELVTLTGEMQAENDRQRLVEIKELQEEIAAAQKEYRANQKYIEEGGNAGWAPQTFAKRAEAIENMRLRLKGLEAVERERQKNMNAAHQGLDVPKTDRPRADTSIADRETARAVSQAKIDAARQRLREMFGMDNTPAEQSGVDAGRAAEREKMRKEWEARLAKLADSGAAPAAATGAATGAAQVAVGAAPIPGLTAPASSVAIGPTFSAAAAQAMGQTGGGPQEKMATNIYEMKNAVVELGLLSREQAKDTKEAVAMYQRFLAAFQYG